MPQAMVAATERATAKVKSIFSYTPLERNVEEAVEQHRRPFSCSGPQKISAPSQAIATANPLAQAICLRQSLAANPQRISRPMV